MRSTDRATPLVILGLAVLLGHGVVAPCSSGSRRLGLVSAPSSSSLLIAAPTRPLFGGRTVIAQFTQPACRRPTSGRPPPTSNSAHPGTRVFAHPGQQLRRLPVGGHHRHRVARRC